MANHSDKKYALSIFTCSVIGISVILNFGFCDGVWGKTSSSHANQRHASYQQQIARLALPSVVNLTIKSESGDILSHGTGFVVAKNLVVTNKQVIDGASRVNVNFADGRSEISDGIIKNDAASGTTLIYVDTQKVVPLRLADLPEPSKGTTVFAVGWPEGLKGLLSTGIVSNFRSFNKFKLIQTNLPISPGSSGGVLLNESGQVIGMTQSETRGGQNLTSAVPASLIKHLIPKKLVQYQVWGTGEWFKIGSESIVGRLAIVINDNAQIHGGLDTSRRLLSVASKGQNLAISAETDTEYAVVMIDKSTGFIAKKDVHILDYQVVNNSPAHRPFISSKAAKSDSLSHQLVQTASEYLGVPYMAGGETRHGIDDAAFVKVVYAKSGMVLPRVLNDQAAIGFDVPRGDYSQWVAGDRMYFACDHPEIDHTGMYIGNGYFIHASVKHNNQVGIDRVDDAYFGSHLVAIRRSKELLDATPTPIITAPPPVAAAPTKQ